MPAEVSELKNCIREMPESDELLVERYKAGEIEAFDTLYLRYRGHVRSIVRRFVSSAWDAEDLVQDVFIKVFRALPRFRGEARFYTWLYQIAINTGLSFTQRRSLEYTNSDELEAATEIGPEHLCSAERREQRMMAAIRGLSAPRTQALLLNVVSGFDYADVGDMLDCPVGTVRSRISRARRLVADAVADY